MAYTDFDLERVRQQFGVTIQTQALFAGIPSRAIPVWLQEALNKGSSFALLSEKSRSEFIIVPFLLTVRDLVHENITIYSGQRLDGDASVGLIGECDFILAPKPPLPILQAPVISIVEAKKNDIEGGLGQCAAQLLGAQRFNLRNNTGIDTVYGCVATGEAWQFLRLQDSILTIDSERYYITELGVILNIFISIIEPFIQ